MDFDETLEWAARERNKSQHCNDQICFSQKTLFIALAVLIFAIVIYFLYFSNTSPTDTESEETFLNNDEDHNE
jgi:hypothetical protein